MTLDAIIDAVLTGLAHSKVRVKHGRFPDYVAYLLRRLATQTDLSSNDILIEADIAAHAQCRYRKKLERLELAHPRRIGRDLWRFHVDWSRIHAYARAGGYPYSLTRMLETFESSEP